MYLFQVHIVYLSYSKSKNLHYIGRSFYFPTQIKGKCTWLKSYLLISGSFWLFSYQCCQTDFIVWKGYSALRTETCQSLWCDHLSEPWERFYYMHILAESWSFKNQTVILWKQHLLQRLDSVFYLNNVSLFQVVISTQLMSGDPCFKT